MPEPVVIEDNVLEGVKGVNSDFGIAGDIEALPLGSEEIKLLWSVADALRPPATSMGVPVFLGELMSWSIPVAEGGVPRAVDRGSSDFSIAEGIESISLDC